MYESNLAATARPVANAGAPRLKILIVAAGRNLAIRILPREPDLEIVALRRAETHVTCRVDHNAICNLQTFKDLFCVGYQRFQFIAGLFGKRELHELYLIKLMLAEDAADVLAIGAGFAAETRRVGGELDGKAIALDNFVSINIG